MKGIIYYTDSSINPNILDGVQRQLLKANLPITSVSLRPTKFGKNIVLNEHRGILTYFRQIIIALENSECDYVFFCEHDILYHPSHFDFTPPRNDVFYYNTNVWKWDYKTKRVITYDHQASLSGLCVNRKLALDFYRKRWELIHAQGWDKVQTSGNPNWARELGYEPGKHKSNKYESALAQEWQSEYPIIDIRHSKNLTPKKMEKSGFKKKPTGWLEGTIDNLPGWHKPWEMV